MNSNVWTVDTAVDELMRLQRMLRALGRREDELRRLVGEIRDRGKLSAHGNVSASWAAEKLSVRLLAPAWFEEREPGR